MGKNRIHDTGHGSRIKPIRRNLLRNFSAGIRRARRDVEFDSTLYKTLLKWARRPGELEELIRFINQTQGADGIQWCQGIYDPDQQMRNIAEFSAETRRPLGPNPYYQKALKDIDTLLQGISVPPYHFTSDEDIYVNLPKKDAHAGYTFLETGKKHKADNVKGALAKLQRFKTDVLQDIRVAEERFVLPASRCQSNPPIRDDGTFDYEKEIKHKTRLIWMIDFYVYLLMYEYQIPFQEALCKTDWYAGGKDFNTELKRLIDRKLQSYRYFWVLDASSFDAHCQGWLIYDCRQYIKGHYRLTKSEDELFDRCTSLLIDKVVWNGEEKVRIHGGVGSGYPSTSTDDSILNQVQVRTALYHFGFEARDFDIVVMGDDILILSNRQMDEDFRKGMQSYLWHNFAYRINIEKQNYGRCGVEYPEFLSRYWRPEGPRRCWQQTIAKVLYPERPRRKQYASRLVTPEDIIFGLIQLYPYDMGEIIQIPEFLKAYRKRQFAELSELVGLGVLPGSVEYSLRYLTLRNLPLTG